MAIIFDFTKYSRDALTQYTTDYIRGIDLHTKDKIIDMLIRRFVCTMIFCVLLACPDLILTGNYSKIMFPKCHTPLLILYNLTKELPKNLYDVMIFSDDENNSANNPASGGEPTKIAETSKIAVVKDTSRDPLLTEKEPKEEEEELIGPEMTMTKPDKINTKQYYRYLKRIIVEFLERNPYILKWGGYIFSSMKSLFGPKFWLRQMVIKSYYVEQKNMYAIMNLFGADRILINTNKSDKIQINKERKGDIFDSANWLEPKDSYGIGYQESDLQSIQNFTLDKELVEVLQTAFSRVGAEYTMNFKSYPYLSIMKGIKEARK
jgi:hypothetical protein